MEPRTKLVVTDEMVSVFLEHYETAFLPAKESLQAVFDMINSSYTQKAENVCTKDSHAQENHIADTGKKVIKDFVGMVEDTHHSDDIADLKRHRKYKALKALLDKPTSKVEVSDEQIKLMVDIYREKSAPGNTHSLESIFKTALQAVFDHFFLMGNMVDPKESSDKWVMPIPTEDEYDWSNLDHGLYKIYWKEGGCSLASVGSLHSGKRWFAPCNWTSKDHSIASSCWNKVKDVKCIISTADFDRDEEPEQPTIEENQLHLEKELIREMIKPKEESKWIERKSGDTIFYKLDDGSIRLEYFIPHWVTHYCIAEDTETFAEQPKDTQSNDGWIEWTGGKCPIVDDNVLVSVKLRGDSKVQPIYSVCDPYTVYWEKDRSHYYHYVIAYRIISERKEEKKDCPHPQTTAFNFTDNEKAKIYYGVQCEICGHAWEQRKEPKKQTLLEYAIKKASWLDNCNTQESSQMRSFFALISEYLEQYLTNK